MPSLFAKNRKSAVIAISCFGEVLRERNIGIDFIAVDPVKKTSTVEVTLDERGSASYDIVADTAWHNIALSPGLLGQVKSSDILVFGSLVGRSDVPLMTLKKLLKVVKFSVFDVNLRKPDCHLEIQLTGTECRAYFRENHYANYLSNKWPPRCAT